MASDETTAVHSSIMQEDDEFYSDVGVDHGYDHHSDHAHNFSRLSICTTNSMYGNDYYQDEEDNDNDNGAVGGGRGGGSLAMGMYMSSRLSAESFDGDADEEISDEKELVSGLSWDSDMEAGSYSLPATPPRRRGEGGYVNQHDVGVGPVKEYASENEARKNARRSKRRRRRRSIMVRDERWLGRAWDSINTYKMEKMGMDNGDDDVDDDEDEEDIMEMGGTNNGNGNGNKYKYSCNYNQNNSFSGESEGGGGGGGLVVITRPKGGRRCLCMDLEEVKACRDLGFELEHERMLEMPSRISISASTLDTSSTDGNSPIASWRISSPGDDPRDVKARLKVWAQAVALASTSRQSS